MERQSHDFRRSFLSNSKPLVTTLVSNIYFFNPSEKPHLFIVFNDQNSKNTISFAFAFAKELPTE